MIAAAPGSPLPLATEVVDRALRSLESEPEVARALSACSLFGRRGGAVSAHMDSSLFLPLEISVVAPASLLETLRQPEFHGRIKQALDLALVSPAVVSRLTVCPNEPSGEPA
jgi:hypothetical protein